MYVRMYTDIYPSISTSPPSLSLSLYIYIYICIYIRKHVKYKRISRWGLYFTTMFVVMLNEHKYIYIYIYTHHISHSQYTKTMKRKRDEVTLFPHQVHACDTMLRAMANREPGALLCHRMGMGKSMSVLHFLAALCGKHVLLVVPVNVLDHWECDAARAGVTVCRVYGAHWREQLDAVPDGHVVLTTHGTLQSAYVHEDARAFDRCTWDVVVLDEVHRFINYNNERAGTHDTTLYTKLYEKISRKFTVAVSGTPLTNNPVHNARSLLQLLGYTVSDHERPAAVLDMFKRRLVRSRTVTSPHCTFPHLSLHAVWCDPPMGAATTGTYVAKRIADTTGCTTAEDVDKLCARDIAALPKYRQLMRMILGWQRQHDTVRIVVVAEYTSLLRCMTRLSPVYTRELCGEHTHAERARTLRWFRSSDTGVRILCLSLACEGLNLPGAQHMVLLHPSESFVREEQAMYRMCRMGTSGTRHVHCMYTRDGCSDHHLRRMQLRKVRALTQVFPAYKKYHAFLSQV